MLCTVLNGLGDTEGRDAAGKFREPPLGRNCGSSRQNPRQKCLLEPKCLVTGRWRVKPGPPSTSAQKGMCQGNLGYEPWIVFVCRLADRRKLRAGRKIPRAKPVIGLMPAIGLARPREAAQGTRAFFFWPVYAVVGNACCKSTDGGEIENGTRSDVLP